MQAVAADLTQRIRAYWRQNQYLRLRIDIDPVPKQGPNGEQIIERYLQLRVLDERHHHDNSLDARSSGFRWFVSFLASFSEFEEDANVVVLLDEPGLSLHARAQADLLRFLDEKLAAKHQLIYTTHSAFMVDSAHLDRVRVVEDTGPEVGAVVRAQLMSRDPDTLSPLQGALGYDIAQNIFVGPDNLVVEGLSDYTYLTVLSEALRAQGRPHLDARWRILAAGGLGTMPAVVSLLGRQLDVTVVADGGTHPPQRLSRLVEEGILADTRLVMLGEAVGLPNADIEDLFDPDDYIDLYNAALGARVSRKELGTDGGRIIQGIDRRFGKFDHNDPANWLLANRATAVPRFRALTLTRFEEAINAINATLNPQ
jgi:predicted ATP-dependent endonuclease of OLD family